MAKRNVLVFPAGTEIGLEIFNSLKYSKEVRVFGAGSKTSNHAFFAYSEYYNLPTIYENDWLNELIKLCNCLNIDYIFPAYDDVIVALSQNESKIPAKIITSTQETCQITRSKTATYLKLGNFIKVPKIYNTPADVISFPVLVKPDRGQGSFQVYKIENYKELLSATSKVPNAIISEYLPGDEYTVDCFSDREDGVLFAHARSRLRIRNGISVHTKSEQLEEIPRLAEQINNVLKLRGAWFFQLKRAKDGELTLLEVAPRIAGAMATHRVMGVNFALLSVFEAERLPLSILTNKSEIQLDRALVNRYVHKVEFKTLYVDLDDTLIINGKVNIEIVKLIFQCINQRKIIVLLTRHSFDLSKTLTEHRLNGLFDKLIHLKNNEPKSKFITEADAILVDDSFAERQEVAKTRGISTFDCSMVELLTNQAEYLNGAKK